MASTRTSTYFVVFLMKRRPQRSTRTDTRCPDTTLIRSRHPADGAPARRRALRRQPQPGARRQGRRPMGRAGGPPPRRRARAGGLHRHREATARIRENSHLTAISFTYLSGPDIPALALTDDEILPAVERGLTAQGPGQTVIEPRVHLAPDPAFRGHFNLLRGYIGTEIGSA